MYLKLVMKKPGLDMEMIQSELNLTYKDRCVLLHCVFNAPLGHCISQAGHSMHQVLL